MEPFRYLSGEYWNRPDESYGELVSERTNLYRSTRRRFVGSVELCG
jgi:hypothetical protein